MNQIAILGTGNLGNAIIDGILENGNVSPQSIFATRNQIEKIAFLKEKGVKVLRENAIAAQNSDIIILCVKPYKVIDVLNEIKSSLTANKIIVSVATGIDISTMQKAIDRNDIAIFRAMPNTASSVSESITCVCGNSDDEIVKNKVISVFEGIGETIFINEELMNAATVIGACGIAYVLRFIRAMIQGGIEIGFDTQTATKIVTQTVKGASQLLIQNGLHPEQEIDKVTTPKGCTIVGLNEMEHQGFSSALIKGIKTSYNKI